LNKKIAFFTGPEAYSGYSGTETVSYFEAIKTMNNKSYTQEKDL